MKRFNIYAGFYELFITDKVLDFPYVFLRKFKTLEEAEGYCTDRGDNFYYDEDIAQYSDLLQLSKSCGDNLEVLFRVENKIPLFSI